MSAVAKNSFATRTGRVPLSSQIAEMLVRDIHAGVLPDGERLPPERIMAQKLGIAVGTLRKALAILAEQGLLFRVQGSGNYINHPLNVENIYALFRLETLTGPATPTAQLINVQKTVRSDTLPLPGKSTHAFRFRRIRYLDDDAAALEEIWLDGRYAPDVDAALISDSLYRFYLENLGLRITRVEDHVGVAELPKWAPSSFTERAVSHWGFVERISRDQHALVAEYSRTWFDPNRARFVAR